MKWRCSVMPPHLDDPCLEAVPTSQSVGCHQSGWVLILCAEHSTCIWPLVLLWSWTLEACDDDASGYSCSGDLTRYGHTHRFRVLTAHVQLAIVEAA